MKRTLIFILVIVWAFTAPVFAYSGGAGTEVDPYIIATKADILQLRDTGGVCGKNFLMTADIDLTGEIFPGAVVPRMAACSFDGGGHKITGLIVNDGGAGKSNLGFFSSVIYSRIVRLTIENCSISGSANSENVGGLVGYFGAEWPCPDFYYTNCTSAPRLRSSLIADCHVSGAVYGWKNVGGLIGKLGDGRVIQCSSTVEVTCTYQTAGGLMGLSCWGNLQNCYAYGGVSGVEYVGGLLGRQESESPVIRYCYSTGHVTGKGYYGGGLIGYSYSSIGWTATCFWDIQTSGISNSAGGIGKTTAQMKDMNTYFAAKWDFASETANGFADYWQMPAGGYPTFYAMPTPAGQGTSAQPYIITTADELLGIGHWSWANFELASDIDLTGRAFTMAPIAPDPDPTSPPYSSNYRNPHDGTAFMGVLDGKCHKITGLTIDDGGAGNGYLGLFGRILDGTVKRLAVEDCTIEGTEGVPAAPNGSYYVGALAGSTSIRSIIEDCRSSGTVRGRRYVGGLAGVNSGSSIARCSSTANVSGPSGTYIGGLLGSNSYAAITTNCSYIADGPVLLAMIPGKVTDCYAGGSVTGRSVGGLAGSNEGKIARCYSVGQVSGSYSAGGLVCTDTSPASVTSSFWDMQTSGQATSAAGTGKTTAEMMSQSTFTGWDFASVWTIDEGASYPRFARDVPKADAGGDQTLTVPLGGKAMVTLDGSGSLGPDCRPLTYQWAGIIDGVPFASIEAKPILELAPGTYVFALVVNNGLMDSEPNTCTVTVIENQLPIAEAGPNQKLFADHTGKATALLDGRASSDPEGKPLSFLWSWSVAGKDLSSTEPNFTTQLPVGVYPFSLIVNDGLDNSAPDTCMVKVIAPVHARLMMVPRILNAKAHQREIAAIISVPGISKADLAPAAPVTLWPFGIQAKRKMVYTVREGRQTYPVIMAFFDADSIIAATPKTTILRVEAETKLTSGRFVVGADYIFVYYPPKHGR